MGQEKSVSQTASPKLHWSPNKYNFPIYLFLDLNLHARPTGLCEFSSPLKNPPFNTTFEFPRRDLKLSKHIMIVPPLLVWGQGTLNAGI